MRLVFRLEYVGEIHCKNWQYLSVGLVDQTSVDRDPLLSQVTAPGRYPVLTQQQSMSQDKKIFRSDHL